MAKSRDEGGVSFGRFREIHAAAQRLGAGLAEVLADMDGKDANARLDVVARARPALDALRARFDAQLVESLAAIEAANAQNERHRERWGDCVVNIKMERDVVAADWPPAAASPDELARRAEGIASALDRIVFRCESLTLSARVNERVEDMRVGESVAVDALVKDDLPRDPALQAALFQELLEQDALLKYGYLDRDTRIVYRVASSRGAQWMSVVRLCAVALAGAAVVVGACFVRPGAAWPFDRASLLPLVASYAFVLVGALVHLVVQGITTARGAKTPTSRPWNDWITWLNAHETKVLWSEVSLMFVFAFLAFTMGHGFTWQAAFFAGYSSDSIVDVALDRFGRVAGAAAKRITGVDAPAATAPAPAATTS